VIITSPKCSKEKMDAIKAYGAELLVSVAGAKEGTPGKFLTWMRVCFSDVFFAKAVLFGMCLHSGFFLGQMCFFAGGALFVWSKRFAPR
jgi:hypothetical protein